MNKFELTGKIVDAAGKEFKVNLKETKNFWITEDGTKYRKTNGTQVNGPCVLLLDSINKETVSIVSVIDRSGSMEGLESDTIGGINAFINNQKKNCPEALFTLILFDDKYEVVYENTPIEKVNPIDDSIYFVRGNTALLDAIGKSINTTKSKRAIFCIITDGQENSSKEYSNKDIKDLITRKESEGWMFQYLGANQDAFAVGGGLGFRSNNIANIDATGGGIRAASCAVSIRSCDYYLSNIDDLKPLSEDYTQEVENQTKNY